MTDPNDRRSTADLIAELQEEASEDGVFRAGLIVGFDESTAKVWSDNTSALECLNDHVGGGGEPLGMLSVVETGKGSFTIKIRALAEYEDEEWVEKYLATVLGTITRDLLAEFPGGVGVERSSQPLIPDDLEGT